MSSATEQAKQFSGEVKPADAKCDASFGAGQARYRSALHQLHMNNEQPLCLSTVWDALVPSHAAAVNAHAEFGCLLREHWATVQDIYPIARGG